MENDYIYDIIIIGAGATGSGIAVDAASRGYKTLLIEKGDFGSGTSSKSTKLVHGGVRYLENAVRKLDLNQFNLVKEGLIERYSLLKNAPNLSSNLRLITPIYRWWELPYMFIGLSLYDFISGKKGLGRSRIVSKKYIYKNFPYIKKRGLIGGVSYYDGSFNDAKLNIALVKTAQKYGADCKNYHEVSGFLYDKKSISGVKVEDKIENQKFEFKAPIVINATGAYSDIVRKLDDKKAKDILDISAGIHIVLDKKYLPSNEGVMIPKTEDGRVLFILPWMGKCLVGTTDEKTTINQPNRVKNEEIEYILKHLEIYFDLKISKNEILSSWKGLRPLVKADKNISSSKITREHLIVKSKSNLISIIGGKWTSYRKMACQCVDFALKNSNLKKQKSLTQDLKLYGNENLQKNFNFKDIDNDIAQYLSNMYADAIIEILNGKKPKRLLENYPYTDLELIYCINEEFVKKPLDFIARRSCLALIDKNSAKNILHDVVDIMKKQLNWSNEVAKKNEIEALEILNGSF